MGVYNEPEYSEVGMNTVFDSQSFNINENLEPDRNSIPGYRQTTNFARSVKTTSEPSKKKKRLITKLFSNLSRLGMDYDDEIIENMRAVPADPNLMTDQEKLMDKSLLASINSNWKVKSDRDKNFFEKDYGVKREALRQLALQPELEDILDTMTNESIVYDSNYSYFAEPYIDTKDYEGFTKDSKDKINKLLSSNYQRLYKLLNWRVNAWDDFKRWLIEGILAWEIVYDSLENPTKIIGLIPIDATTLTKKVENNKIYYIQFAGVNGRERKLLDSQVVYIQYQETNAIARISYLERLIRPFNIYRIIEQAQLIWTITNASYKMKFTIPVKNMSRAHAMQTLSSAMNRYKEDIKFVGDTGELTVNGQVNLPFNKEYWMPETESGSPQIETLGGEGPELNDSDYLKFFKNQLYKISKIPLSRFDQESGETWFGADASSVARTEIDFGRFVTRLRNTFSQIILKPLIIQLCIDMPELQEERPFLNSIQLKYNSYNIFEELLEMDLMQKRVEFIQMMKDSMVDMDPNGCEVKFFSSEFLVKKYLKMSDADLAENAKMKEKEMEELNLAGGEGTETLLGGGA
jgi:hypothetical protein